MKSVVFVAFMVGLAGCASFQQGSAPSAQEDTLASVLAGGLLEYAISGGDGATLAGILASETVAFAVREEGTLDRVTKSVTNRVVGEDGGR